MDTLLSKFPLLKTLIALQPTSWFNPNITSVEEGVKLVGLGQEEIQQASERLNRFAAYLAKAFPETTKNNGIIESEVIDITEMKKQLQLDYGKPLTGRLMLKKDSHLPIAGSIKARGGIYEVLTHAEKLAMQAGLLEEGDDYGKLCSEPFKQFFSQYSIAVGSTGNLGLSIGIISAKLGFSVSVHMSADARQWKKDKLRTHGVNVVEYNPNNPLRHRRLYIYQLHATCPKNNA